MSTLPIEGADRILDEEIAIILEEIEDIVTTRRVTADSAATLLCERGRKYVHLVLERECAQISDADIEKRLESISGEAGLRAAVKAVLLSNLDRATEEIGMKRGFEISDKKTSGDNVLLFGE